MRILKEVATSEICQICLSFLPSAFAEVKDMRTTHAMTIIHTSKKAFQYLSMISRLINVPEVLWFLRTNESTLRSSDLKGLPCQCCVVYIVYNACYASLFAMKLEQLSVSGKIYYSPKQLLQATKIYFQKLLHEQVFKNAIRFNFSSSSSIFTSFSICCVSYIFF